MMECERFDDLISAYNDDELTEQERKRVEQHLETCDTCREKLTRYRYSSAEIIKLQIPEPEADIRNVTMAKLATLNASNGQRRKKLATVFLPIILILAIVVPLQVSGFFAGTAGVIAKAVAAAETIESYRVKSELYRSSDFTDNEPFLKMKLEVDCASADTYHLIREVTSEFGLEMIVIGDTVYGKGDVSKPYTPEQLDGMIPDKEKIARELELLTDIEVLEDEIIDGVLCYHYRGIVDPEAYWKYYEPKLIEIYEKSTKPNYDYLEEQNAEKDESEQMILPEFEAELEKALEAARTRIFNLNQAFDYWIDKNAYLIIRCEASIRYNNSIFNQVDTALTVYSDFNERIVIEPPLTETGDLLDGWHEFSRDTWQD